MSVDGQHPDEFDQRGTGPAESGLCPTKPSVAGVDRLRNPGAVPTELTMFQALQ